MATASTTLTLKEFLRLETLPNWKRLVSSRLCTLPTEYVVEEDITTYGTKSINAYIGVPSEFIDDVEFIAKSNNLSKSELSRHIALQLADELEIPQVTKIKYKIKGGSEWILKN